MIIDALMVPAIHSGEAERIEPLLAQLTDREISALSPTTIMGLNPPAKSWPIRPGSREPLRSMSAR